MYAKHGKVVDADACGAKASTKHLESRLEVIQGNAFSHHWKADEGLRITVGFRVGKVSASPFSRTSFSFRQPRSREPQRIFAHLILLETTFILSLIVFVYLHYSFFCGGLWKSNALSKTAGTSFTWNIHSSSSFILQSFTSRQQTAYRHITMLASL